MFETWSFMEWLIIGLIGLLFFKEQMFDWLGNKFGINEGEDPELTPEWAKSLIQYVNHDTTKMHEKTHEKLEKIEDTMKEVSWTLKDIRDNGIACKNYKSRE